MFGGLDLRLCPEALVELLGLRRIAEEGLGAFMLLIYMSKESVYLAL
jgi:hypothetical protein